MKNVHVIPTDKPSRLAILHDDKLHIGTNFKKDLNVNPQHIYITSDEEIKEGDWIFNEERELSVLQCIGQGSLRGWNKIILTTDIDLIKDGVQAIDDEFLEWFVKNPSCESVKTQRWYDGYTFGYKIIISKEEPKQEILEDELWGNVFAKIKQYGLNNEVLTILKQNFKISKL